jgi:membrane associated rhomboid family serine protease
MTNPLESAISSAPEKETGEQAGWLKVGAVAAGSALIGGLLAAWWYRKTLSKLRQAEEDDQNPHFGIPAEDPADEA